MINGEHPFLLAKTIDEIVFNPMAEELMLAKFDKSQLDEYVEGKETPWKYKNGQDHLTGSVFEAYINMNITLNFPNFGKFVFKGNHETSSIPIRSIPGWNGNIYLQWGEISTEIDGLYTFHEDEAIFPIIIEAKYSKNGKINVEAKSKIIREIFGQHPYFVRIGLKAEGEEAGIYPASGLHDVPFPKYYRRISLSPIPGLPEYLTKPILSFPLS